MKRFWKLWYRLKKWWRYRSYYRNLPDHPEEYVGTTVNGEEVVGHVKEGIQSRPIPIPSHPTSNYGKRVARAKVGGRTSAMDGRGSGIDEDLAISKSRSKSPPGLQPGSA